ncbi:MAG TPA: MogA/MoaB family molybdenum cofactor biosynthesis protein [Candidatus Dormibacteraeota bacterium]|jgi:molybdenum cofactor synthesis domain-containing protein
MSAAVPVRAAVLAVSDAGARGERADTSGDVICSRLEALPATLVSRGIVPDEPDAIRAAVVEATAKAGLLVITGGTGVGPRDVTPQSVGPLLDYEVPGMAEAMRLRGLASTPHAMLSRQVVGVRGGCLLLCLPGSPKAVAECLDAIWEALPHALRLLAGERPCHEPPAGRR